MYSEGVFLVLVGLMSQVTGISLTLDEDAQLLCKKYKMMCKGHEVCAVQHFTEPQMTMPVCIPLSFVPVRNLVCRLPPEKGSCHARYTRWHYNIHQQGCTHFQYGGCGGNQNNFMSRDECEDACLRTPTIQLIDGGAIKPAIMTAPVYKPPKNNKYEALNSVMLSSPEYNSQDRYQVMKHRINRVKPSNEVSTRKRRRLEKERAAKEKRRRKRRKERRRLRKLEKRQRRKNRKRGGKKSKKGGKKKKKSKETMENVNETPLEEEQVEEENNAEIAAHNAAIVEEAEKIVNNKIESLVEEEKEDEEERRLRKERRKERKRKKRRQKRKKRRLERSKRHHHKRSPQYAELRGSEGSTMFKMFKILDDENIGPQDNSLLRAN